MGNGSLYFIDEKVMYQDFFNNDEIITYKDPYDLLSKLKEIKNNDRYKSKNAKKKLFFFNTIVADNYSIKLFYS